MNKKYFIALLFSFLIPFLFSVDSFAILGSVAEREQQLGIDLVLEAGNLDYTAPNWFVPHSLSSAPEDASYWINNVLPYEQDRYEDVYIVIPQVGLIAPVVFIPQGTSDFNAMVSGGEISINPYLQNGVIQYVNGSGIGYRGKNIHFGHSNYFSSDTGRYKTIFAENPRLEPNDQIRYYVKNSTGTYDLFKYSITESYNTSPSNVGIMSRDGSGADDMLIGCTYGLAGRRIIQSTFLGEPLGKPVPYVDPYANLNSNWRRRIDKAVSKINWMAPNFKSYTIIQFVKSFDQLRISNLTNDQKLALDYIEEKLVLIYPE